MLVVVFEGPAGGFRVGPLDRPVAGTADFLSEHPLRGAFDGDARRPIGFTQSVSGDGRVPDRGVTGLEEEALAVVDHQVVELPKGFHARGVVAIVAENIQRHDGVHHRRVNRAQAIGVLEALEHPVLTFPHGDAADAGKAVLLPKLQDLVGVNEGLAPREEGVISGEFVRAAREMEFGKVKAAQAPDVADRWNARWRARR